MTTLEQKLDKILKYVNRIADGQQISFEIKDGKLVSNINIICECGGNSEMKIIVLYKDDVEECLKSDSTEEFENYAYHRIQEARETIMERFDSLIINQYNAKVE